MKISVQILGIALVASLCFSSCSSPQKATQELTNLMEVADKTVQKNPTDTAAAATFVRQTAAFMEKYPKQILDSTLLYKAGDYALVLTTVNQSFEKSSVFGKYAILFFDALMKNYPDFSQTGMCYFNKALTYEFLGKLAEAENQYREFMARYPEDPLTANIQMYLDNAFGKSEDQIMAEILEKNKNNTDMEDVPVEHVKAR